MRASFQRDALHALCASAGTSQGVQIDLGQLSQQILRPRKAATNSISAICRNWCWPTGSAYDADRGQRAPQHRLQHDGDAEPDRRRARSTDQERQDLRVGNAAEPDAAEPFGRGICDPRRHVERPARGRVPARHRHGILGQPGQPGDGARQVPGIAQDHPAGLDPGRPDHPLRPVLHLSIPQPVAAAVPEAASALLHRRHRQPGDDRDRGRATASATPPCSSPSSARFELNRESAPARRRISATRSGPISCRC